MRPSDSLFHLLPLCKAIRLFRINKNFKQLTLSSNSSLHFQISSNLLLPRFLQMCYQVKTTSPPSFLSFPFPLSFMILWENKITEIFFNMQLTDSKLILAWRHFIPPRSLQNGNCYHFFHSFLILTESIRKQC